jgi:hypothetical protein
MDVSIPGDVNDPSVLQPCVVRLSIRSERRRKAGYEQQGVVEIDLADVADSGRLSRSFLVHESLLNCTLKVSVRMQLKSGDAMFRRQGVVSGHLPSSVASTPPIRLVPSTASSSTSLKSSIIASPMRATESTSSGPGSLLPVTILDASDSHRGTGRANSYALGDLEAAVSRNHCGNIVGHVSEAEHFATQSGRVLSESEHTVSSLRRAEMQLLAAAQAGNRGNALTVRSSVSEPFVDDSFGSRGGSWAAARDAAPATRAQSGLRSDGVAPNMSPPLSSLRSRSTTPLSPRSPSGSTSAAAVLDHLVPEAVQKDVYELVRLRRIRREVPKHIVDSRVPVAAVLDRILVKERSRSAAEQASAPRMPQALSSLAELSSRCI